MSLIPKMIYRFNEIAIKIPIIIFTKIEKPTPVRKKKKKWGGGNTMRSHTFGMVKIEI